MSDTEEVVITRAVRQPKNTKPEIAREKLKEKRLRLKREKDDLLIEEAKKRLGLELEKKQQDEILAKQDEEQKKKSDPTYALMMKMEQMMSMLQVKESPKELVEPIIVKPKSTRPLKASTRPLKKIEVADTEEDEYAKPLKKVRQKTLPKPKKKVVYLQKGEPKESETNQFVGYDIAPPAEPIQYQPSNGLLASLMSRRNMNSFQYN